MNEQLKSDLLKNEADEFWADCERKASELDITVQEKSIGSEEFINSDEAFATSTAGGIIPITKINGKKINNGKIGKVTSQLKNLYWEKHTDPQWSQSVDELI